MWDDGRGVSGISKTLSKGAGGDSEVYLEKGNTWEMGEVNFEKVGGREENLTLKKLTGLGGSPKEGGSSW